MVSFPRGKGTKKEKKEKKKKKQKGAAHFFLLLLPPFFLFPRARAHDRRPHAALLDGHAAAAEVFARGGAGAGAAFVRCGRCGGGAVGK